MHSKDDLAAVAARYAVAITPALNALINEDDDADPIAAQFRPDARELAHAPDERADPIGDAAHAAAPGIVHRYPDRVLLAPTKLCHVYCRFCFRRESVGPGEDAMLAPAALDAAFAYIAERPAIWEVILTGGDPFVLSDRRVAAIGARLAAIPHVKVVRWHTRGPVAAPERVTPALVEALRIPGKAVWIALHVNHPRELTAAADRAIARLADAGFPLVSQTVLLEGVNADAVVLERLMRAFVERRIKPYYLHHLDRAPGTKRFRASIETGQEIVQTLRANASGLCQPAYVLDLPGGVSKAPLAPACVRRKDDGWEALGADGLWRAVD